MVSGTVRLRTDVNNRCEQDTFQTAATSNTVDGNTDPLGESRNHALWHHCMLDAEYELIKAVHVHCVLHLWSAQGPLVTKSETRPTRCSMYDSVQRKTA